MAYLFLMPLSLSLRSFLEVQVVDVFWLIKKFKSLCLINKTNLMNRRNKTI